MEEMLKQITALRDVIADIDRMTKENPQIIRAMELSAVEKKAVVVSQLDALVSFEQVREALKASQSAVNELVNSGKLPCVVVGSGMKKFPVSEVNRFIMNLERVNQQ